jgi:N-methylhydantoinase B
MTATHVGDDPASLLDADPLLIHVIRNALSNVVRKMSVAVTRTAYSSLISGQAGAIGDTEAAILSVDGSLIATDEAQIIHMASLPTGMRYVLDEFPLDTVREGDIFINNHPHRGAIHSNDTMLFRPVFEAGQIRFWCAVMAHLTDLGGMAAGGMAVEATSIFAEGLIIPPSRFYAEGVRNESLLTMVAANSRQPEETVGDLLALVAGAHVGAEDLRALIDVHGWPTLSAAVNALWDHTEQIVRDSIRSFPDGTYQGRSAIDDDGIDSDRHYEVVANVRVEGGDVHVHFQGTSAQARGSINSSYAQSLTAVTYALRCYFGRGSAVNQGMWRAMHITLTPGTLVNPNFPAACNTRMANTTPSIVEAVLWALREHASEDVGYVAGGGVPDVHGVSPYNETPFWLYWEANWGGGGARDGVDGVDGGGTPMRGGTEAMIPVETAELAYPVLIERFARRQDTGGPGRFRGGCGIEKVIRFECPSIISGRTDRWLYPPRGLDGGLDGAPGAYVLNPGTDGERYLPSKFAGVRVQAGDRIAYRTVGGGGIGRPFDRETERVLDDVIEGRVSVAAAAADYGVVLERGDDRRWSVDGAATATLRATGSVGS